MTRTCRRFLAGFRQFLQPELTHQFMEGVASVRTQPHQRLIGEAAQPFHTSAGHGDGGRLIATATKDRETAEQILFIP